MVNKGQIVEIPATSSLYNRVIPAVANKKELLSLKSQKSTYSLFDGFLVGEHSGVEHFKIGQRKGIKVGGKKEPLYVIAIDENENRLFVGAGENHPGLWTEVFSFNQNNLHWKTDGIFNNEDLETGIAVQVVSPIFDEELTAKLYSFSNAVFLEFAKPTVLILKDHDIELMHNNSHIADIK